MIRVMQLSPASADFQTRRSLEHLAVGLGSDLQITRLTIGPGGDARNAFLAGMRIRRLPPSDLIHAWGSRALAAAVLGSGRRIIYTPDPKTEPKTNRWLRSAIRRSQLQIVCPTQFMQKQFSPLGIAPENSHVIPPTIEFDRVVASPNPSLRSELGLDKSAFVVLAPGESTRSAAHRLAVWAVSILHVMDSRFQILLEGRGEQLDALIRFAERARQPKLLTVANQRLGREIDLETLVSAADAAIVTADGNFPTLPVAVCMAAGLPIVCGAGSAAAEILESGRTGMILPAIAPKAFSQSIWQLSKDAGLRQNLGQAARAESEKFASPLEFSDRWKNLYEKIADAHPIAAR
jgi:glycosyltransferase involved in cell wall biosynthesis